MREDRPGQRLVTEDEWQELLLNTKAVPLDFADPTTTKMMQRVRDAPVYSSFPVKIWRDEIGNNLQEPRIKEIELTWPFFEGVAYKFGEKISKSKRAVDRNTRMPFAFLLGIGLRYERSKFVQIFDEQSDEKFKVSAQMKQSYFNKVLEAQTTENKANLVNTLCFDGLSLDCCHGAKQMKLFHKAVEESWTKNERQVVAPTIKEKTRRMLRVNDAHVVAPELVFAPVDIFVIDQLLGIVDQKTGTRCEGKFAVPGANNVKTQYGGYIDTSKPIKGEFSSVSEEAHRLIRFEVQGLVSRVHGYMHRWKRVGREDIVVRLGAIASELKSFYRTWLRESGDVYKVAIC